MCAVNWARYEWLSVIVTPLRSLLDVIALSKVNYISGSMDILPNLKVT